MPGRRKLLAVCAFVLLLGTGGIAAKALAGHSMEGSTETGNSQPIDDNHSKIP